MWRDERQGFEAFGDFTLRKKDAVMKIGAAKVSAKKAAKATPNAAV